MTVSKVKISSGSHSYERLNSSQKSNRTLRVTADEISFVMFANTFQSGFVSIFYSVGSNPLQLWDKQVKNGHIRRVVDEEVRSLVLEISGTNVATTYITCPIKPRLSLGIKLPFLVMIIKNMKKYFTFEIQILDDKDMHRRFRVSNFQSTTKVRPFCTTMPIGLSNGWNQVQFNLADFTKRAYGSTYLETTRVQIHANVKIRRIYFSDVLYSDEDLPNEYKLFLPVPGSQKGQRPSQAEKKQSVSVSEKKQSKKISMAEVAALQPEEIEGEPPSGAPPSPTGDETPAAEMPPSTPIDAPASEPATDSELIAEPPSDRGEEMPTDTTTEATTEATTEPSEVAESAGEEAVVNIVPEGEERAEKQSIVPAPDGEAQGATVEEAPAEGGEAASAIEEPAEAAAAPEEAPASAVPEKAPAEAAPEEAPAAEETAEAQPAEAEPVVEATE